MFECIFFRGRVAVGVAVTAVETINWKYLFCVFNEISTAVILLVAKQEADPEATRLSAVVPMSSRCSGANPPYLQRAKTAGRLSHEALLSSTVLLSTGKSLH